MATPPKRTEVRSSDGNLMCTLWIRDETRGAGQLHHASDPRNRNTNDSTL